MFPQKLVKKVNEREAKYQTVMRDLIKRYIMHRQRSQQSDGVTEDDLNEIKQDISSFRYELLEILRESGMKIPNYASQKSKSKPHQKLNKMYRKINFSLQLILLLCCGLCLLQSVLYCTFEGFCIFVLLSVSFFYSGVKYMGTWFKLIHTHLHICCK